MTNKNTIPDLERKLKGALTELDKMSSNFFAAQDSIRELTEKIEEKKHTEQLAGWALDRAIETAKIMKTDNETIKGTAQIIQMAAEYLAGVSDLSGKKEQVN